MSSGSEATQSVPSSPPSTTNPVVDYSKEVTPFCATRYAVEVCAKLKSSVFTSATALAYFHSFYKHTTFEEFDPYTIACTCIYLASKVVDDDIRIRDIINVGLSCIKRNAPPLMLEPYFTMRDSLTQAELLVMRVLGFKLKIDLPHRYLLHYLQAVEDWIGKSEFTTFPISQTSWKVLQDLYHDEIVIQHPPQVLAAACLHMVLEMYGIVVPSDLSDPWYTVLHPECTTTTIMHLTMRIFALYEEEKKLVFIEEDGVKN